MACQKLGAFLLSQIKMSNDTIFSATEEIARAAWLNGHLVGTVTVFRKALRPHGPILENRPEPHLAISGTANNDAVVGVGHGPSLEHIVFMARMIRQNAFLARPLPHHDILIIGARH
jgi:hypothetical protein